ncbi:hypothetical protein C8N33_102503 [Pararhodobacter aggregans]|nr:hypothetical protein C8N33_102503 [Pararhodobacter aggregans]
MAPWHNLFRSRPRSAARFAALPAVSPRGCQPVSSRQSGCGGVASGGRDRPLRNARVVPDLCNRPTEGRLVGWGFTPPSRSGWTIRGGASGRHRPVGWCRDGWSGRFVGQGLRTIVRSMGGTRRQPAGAARRMPDASGWLSGWGVGVGCAFIAHRPQWPKVRNESAPYGLPLFMVVWPALWAELYHRMEESSGGQSTIVAQGADRLGQMRLRQILKRDIKRIPSNGVYTGHFTRP